MSKKTSQLLENGIANTRRHIGYHSAGNAQEDGRLEKRRPNQCQASSVDALDDRKARVADCCPSTVRDVTTLGGTLC